MSQQAALLRLAEREEEVGLDLILPPPPPGLYYLEINNILHRDLKVANLLLNRHGILKIADFGKR